MGSKVGTLFFPSNRILQDFVLPKANFTLSLDLNYITFDTNAWLDLLMTLGLNQEQF